MKRRNVIVVTCIKCLNEMKMTSVFFIVVWLKLYRKRLILILHKSQMWVGFNNTVDCLIGIVLAVLASIREPYYCFLALPSLSFVFKGYQSQIAMTESEGCSLCDSRQSVSFPFSKLHVDLRTSRYVGPPHFFHM
jgi:hypothetical protein